MNTQKIKDYLSNKASIQKDNDILTNPAMLFENKTNQGYGNIYLFDRFGHAENCTYNISSQITDHYMEDNVSRQDHWAIAPDEYILSGFIGEVIYNPPKLWRSQAEKYATDYLKPLSILSPTFDNYTESALNVVQAVETSYIRYEQIAQNIYSDLTGSIKKSNQRYIIKVLKLAQLQRQLFNVWTPYKTFENLAIQNISISQGNSKYKSRLEIKFKQWKSVSSDNTRAATEKEKKSYLAMIQQMQEQDNGTVSTNNVEFASSMYKGVRAGKNLIMGYFNR